MAVIGTPIEEIFIPQNVVAPPVSNFIPTPCCGNPADRHPFLTALACGDQNVIAAPVSTIDGRPLLSRMRAVQINGGQEARVRWTMIDREGNPIDLTGCVNQFDSSASSGLLDGLQLKFRLREYLSIGRQDLPPKWEYEATVLTPAAGEVEAVLPARATNTPGVYFAEMAIVGQDSYGDVATLFSNTFYVIINRGLWSARASHPGGPPSIMEVRLHLRDSNEAEGFLADNVTFDDAEIAHAIAKPVMYWNEIPPPIGTYTTSTFPYRYHHLEGIAAQLFYTIAEHNRKGNLTYSAAGVTIDDYDKEPNYEAAAARRWQAFTDFVRRKKAEINLGQCFGTVSSPYTRRSNW